MISPLYKRYIVILMMAMLIIFANFLAYAQSDKSAQNDLIIQGTEAFEKSEYQKSINYFMDAARNGEKSGDYKLACLAYYNLGVAYFRMLETGEALSNFQKAYEICHKYNLGPIREVEILGGIAGVFYQQENFAKAYEFASKGLEAAQNNKDTLMIVNLSTNMALISNKLGQFDKTDQYLALARKINKSENNSLTTLINEIEADKLLLMGEYAQAEVMLRQLLSEYGTEKSGTMYISLLDVLVNEGKVEEALKVAEEAYPYINFASKISYYTILSNLYAQLGKYKEALEFSDSVQSYKDSVSVLNNKQLIENSNVKLEVLKYQLEADRKVMNAESRTRLWFFLSLVLLLVCVVIIMVTVNMRQRTRARHQYMELQLEKEQNEKKLAQEKMEETEKFAVYRQEMLKREIEHKKREVEAHQMFLSSRKDLLQDMLNHLSSDKDVSQMPTIKSLIKHVNQLLNKDDKEKDDFMLNYEAGDPELTKKLLDRHPELLQSDIKFLSYVRMNLSSKEIGVILNITPDSCKRRKIRISQKLGLTSSSELYPYLINL